MDLTYENPTSEKVQLQINKAKYFGFKCNSVDEYQSDIKLMDDWSADAGKQMSIQIDRDILGYIYADAAAENAGLTAGKISGAYNMGVTGTPVEITKSNIIDFIVDTSSVLYEQDVPEENRWIVLPVWMCNLIKKSELKDASMSGDGTSMMRNGRIGMIDQYTVYSSNNMSHVTDGTDKVANIVFGHKKALTFASQMTEMDTLPNQKDFGKLVRGLNVFGSKVIDSSAIGHGYCTKGV
jgi:hypothetical protein